MFPAFADAAPRGRGGPQTDEECRAKMGRPAKLVNDMRAGPRCSCGKEIDGYEEVKGKCVALSPEDLECVRKADSGARYDKKRGCVCKSPRKMNEHGLCEW